MKTILIDDMRPIEADVVCRTFKSAINALKTLGPFSLLYLDHDLGEIDEDGQEMSMNVDGQEYPMNGYGVMCFLEDNREFLPSEIMIVSSNPVGRKRMQVVINKLYGDNQ